MNNNKKTIVADSFDLAYIKLTMGKFPNKTMKIKKLEDFKKLFSINVKNFDIIKVKEGKGSIVIFIDGFLSADNSQGTKDWESQLKKIYPDNPWYCLTWEAKSVKDVSKNFGKHLFAYILGPEVGVPIHIWTLLNNSWHSAFRNAGKTGVHLAKILSCTDESYILCGHSLGARVIYYTLQALAIENKGLIKDVHLLGGAVGNTRNDWKNAKKSVRGTITNYSSCHDSILRKLYKVSTLFFSKPIGLHKINVEGILNKDVSDIVSGHMEYKSNFSKIVNAKS